MNIPDRDQEVPTARTRPRLRRRVVLAILSAWLCFASLGIDEPKGLAEERERHQGTWRATFFLFDGTETPKEVVETISRVVEGDHVVWKRDGKNFAGTKVKLDPSADPKAIDVVADGGPNRDKRVEGIYKLEDDELTLCMAPPDGERPKVFKAEKGSGRTLMKFRRPPKP